MHSHASGVPDVWLRFTSLFLPDELRADPERHRRGRISVGVLVAASFFALQWVPAYPLVMPAEAAWPLTWLLAGCVALSLALLFVCRWSHIAAVHALLAYVTLMFFVAERHTGGYASFVAIWNLVLPVCAMLVGGGRAAWTWLGIALGHYVLLFALAQAGVEYPNLIWPEMRLPIAALSVASLTLLVLMLGALSEVAHTSALESLRAVRAELVAARDAAEAASGAKAEFLANASHEIRTPMTAVLGFADVLLDECDPATTPEGDRDALLTMRRNAAQLLDVINDILDLAKLEAGRLELDPAAFSPAELLRDALAAFRPEARQRGISLEIESEPGIPDELYGDRARIAQVLLHLVGNAIKFTERGGVTVRSRYAGSRLSIEVADTGIGMTPEQLERLFEPFSQGDGSSTRARGGAGIGLSLCKRLVDLMGGEIRAESAPGRGTTFRLELAAGAEVAVARCAEREAAPGGAAPAPRPAPRAESPWSRIERYFLPVLPVDSESAARARITIASALAAMAFVPVFTALWAVVLPGPAAARLIACQFVVGAACLFALFSLRRTGSAALASHLLLACYFGLCTAGMLLTGGALSPHLGWIALLPPFALAFLGRRGASAWSLAGALFPIGLLVAHRMGVESRDLTLTNLWSLTWLVTVASQTALTSVLALVYERSREESLRGLEQTNAALARTRDAAERASRARSEFLSNVSHEIRTPMTAVLGFADLLSGEWRDAAPERIEALQTIRRNGAHLLALLGDLLDLSQIEAGRLAIQRVAFAPAALANEVAGLLRERAESKGLALRVQISPAVPARVLGDPTRTRQILVNLLGNAVKFTQRGRVELVLDADRAAAQSALRLEVRDTGVGIEPEKLSALFQRFVQADERVSTHFGGSGLGLAICRRLAELLGGSIEATSERGVGSRFRVTLPADAVAEPAQAQALPPAAYAPARRSGALHGRVLLAEDGPDNQNLILRVLRKAGAEVELAENGAQAREAAVSAQAEGRPFGAILMDLEMPVEDGVSATRELRVLGVTTPIIALTAHAKSELPAEVRGAGFDDFASKPIDRRALLDTLARWLEPRKSDSP